MADKLVAPAGVGTGAGMNFRWTVLIWLVAGGIINYIDRASLSIAAPEIRKDRRLCP